jgi:hypothetical protein
MSRCSEKQIHTFHSSLIPTLRIQFQPAISVIETQAQSALEECPAASLFP